MLFDLGPFRFYRVERDNTLCISLKCLDDWACGWEYGWRDVLRNQDKPILELRIGKLRVLYIEPFESGCEIGFMGFWAFPTWGSKYDAV